MNQPFTIIDHIVMREVTMRDASRIYKALHRNRTYFRTWLPFADTLTEEAEREFLASVLQVPRPERNLTFVITEGRHLCGLVGFVRSDSGNHRTEIGYWLLPEYQHRGIMTTCVRILCRIAFEQSGMHRIQIRCATGNGPSNAIPVRLGFRLEGTERDGERMYDGTYTDLNVYSLLEGEM